MINVDICRLEQSNDGTIGAMRVNNQAVCWTLEPSPDRFVIPAGDYLCRSFHGAKYSDTFEILVPGHTAVLFHWGNTEDDTLGCVLLGFSVGWLAGKRAVLQSRNAFKYFMTLVGGVHEFALKIISV